MSIVFFQCYYLHCSVPEIGEDVTDKNLLLRTDGLPEFNNITIEKCVGAIGYQSADVEKSVKKIEESIKTENVKDIFTDIINPLEVINCPLETTWGLAKTLYLGNSTLMPTKSYLTIHERSRRARSTKFNSLPIYTCVSNNLNDKNHSFTEEQKRILLKYKIEGKLNGIDLDINDKNKLGEILNKLGTERSKFKGKTDMAIKQFSQIIDDPQLIKEFPPKFLQSISQNQSQTKKGPWRVTLQPQVTKTFLQYCPDRAMRWNLWQADTRKCSGQNDKNLETSTHLEEIRFLRREQAKLLGYDNYVKMSMETKMAGSVENIQNMLIKLIEHARPKQEKEIEELQKFATENLDCKYKLDVYDIDYFKRKQMEALFQYDDELIREYFPIPKVLAKLFELSEKLFDIKIVERTNVDTWNEDVRYYDIFDVNVDGGKEPISGIYFDLYSREDEKIFMAENKGWMVGIRNKSNITLTKPLSALIFNFDAPIYGKPSLLSLREVHMLFHKFGHALQHLLAKSDYNDLAGLSNVEWDAVEISGHLMSNLLHNSKTLQDISSHYANEDKLSDNLLNSISRYRKHMTGYELSQQLYLSALDLELHIRKDFWLDIVKDLWPQFYCFDLDKKYSHPCSWTQVFSGEWGAAYYSHLWSKLVAADVYSAFALHDSNANETEFLNTGKRFRNTFLTYGGTCHPSEVFRRFRGRDPSPKALLNILGLYDGDTNQSKNASLSKDE